MQGELITLNITVLCYYLMKPLLSSASIVGTSSLTGNPASTEALAGA